MKTSLLISSAMMLGSTTAIHAQTEATDSLAGAYYDLDDLVVVADKPYIQSDGAKLTYNLKEDTGSKGSTVLEALRKVPMVTVDGEDNIRINGQQNFKIYVNGKEDPSISANYKYIFKAMPAEAVVRIEVITEPGAKYDAEGTAGILNIVTDSAKKSDGYSGSVTASLTKSQNVISVAGSMKLRRFAISAHADYSNMRLFPQSNSNLQTIENLSSEDARFQTDYMKRHVGVDYIGAGLTLSYDLSDKDLITLNSNLTNVGADLTKGKSFTETHTYNAAHELTASMKRNLSAKIGQNSFSAEASWQHNFDSNGHKTVLSYLFNHGRNNLLADFLVTESTGTPLVSPFLKMSDKSFNNEHTVQFDYINPFGEGRHTLETGAKGIWRDNKGKSAQFNGKTEADATESMSDRSDLTQIQDIYALYASYVGYFGNFSLTGGLRYEHTRMGIRFHWGDGEDFTNSLDDAVPNAAVAYMFSPASNLRLSYQMRISRPSLSQVNPFRQNIRPNSVEMGNPGLSSEKANKISLTYTNFGRVCGGNIGVEYSSVDNAIANVYYSVGDVFYTTYGNIGHNRNLTFSGFFNWTIIRGMQMSVNMRATRQMLSSPAQGLSNHGWNFNYGGNLNYSPGGGWKFNIYGGQDTRNYDLSGYSSGWYYYGLGIGKGFMKDEALTVTVNANNFLQGTTNFRKVTHLPDYKSDFIFKNHIWNVGVTLSWRFGSLKSDVKKTDVSISNDDKSSLSGTGGLGM